MPDNAYRCEVCGRKHTTLRAAERCEVQDEQRDEADV